MRKPDSEMDVSTILLESDLPDKAMARGVREALLRHKKLGTPIAAWKDGEVRSIPAEEIEVPPEEPLDE